MNALDECVYGNVCKVIVNSRQTPLSVGRLVASQSLVSRHPAIFSIFLWCVYILTLMSFDIISRHYAFVFTCSLVSASHSVVILFAQYVSVSIQLASSDFIFIYYIMLSGDSLILVILYFCQTSWMNFGWGSDMKSIHVWWIALETKHQWNYFWFMFHFFFA